MPTLTSNGVTLAYEVRGEGPEVLLISGLGYGGWMWRWLTDELAPHYRVLTFDNRGLGGSDKPPGPYTTRLMADDAAGLLEGLGVRAAHVVGLSLGGLIAQELALAWPERVRTLVLACTVGGPSGVPITPAALEVMRNRQGDPLTLIRRGLALACAPGFGERRPERLAELVAHRLACPVPPGGYAAQFAAGAAHDAEARLGAVRCPTLCLTGDADFVVPHENAELLARRIPGARHEVLPGLGHLFPAEDEQATARALRRFWETR
jgi:pimeloyl-ACP methyl ester carboxylesterase